MKKFDELIEKKMKMYEAFKAIGSNPMVQPTSSPTSNPSAVTGSQTTPDTGSGMGQPKQVQQNVQAQQAKPDMNTIKKSIEYLKQFAGHPEVNKMLQSYMQQPQMQ